MQHTIQHLYKAHGDDSLLYAWFLSMHTRVDIILCCQKSENELKSGEGISLLNTSLPETGFQIIMTPPVNYRKSIKELPQLLL